MPTKINYVKLYRDGWSTGPLVRTQNIIGLDVAKLNIEIEVSGNSMPKEIEVEVRTREPGNKTGGKSTISPTRFKIHRTATSNWYHRNVGISAG